MGLYIDAKYDVGLGFRTLLVAANVHGLNGGLSHEAEERGNIANTSHAGLSLAGGLGSKSKAYSINDGNNMAILHLVSVILSFLYGDSGLLSMRCFHPYASVIVVADVGVAKPLGGSSGGSTDSWMSTGPMT